MSQGTLRYCCPFIQIKKSNWYKWCLFWTVPVHLSSVSGESSWSWKVALFWRYSAGVVHFLFCWPVYENSFSGYRPNPFLLCSLSLSNAFLLFSHFQDALANVAWQSKMSHRKLWAFDYCRHQFENFCFILCLFLGVFARKQDLLFSQKLICSHYQIPLWSHTFLESWLDNWQTELINVQSASKEFGAGPWYYWLFLKFCMGFCWHGCLRNF